VKSTLTAGGLACQPEVRMRVALSDTVFMKLSEFMKISKALSDSTRIRIVSKAGRRQWTDFSQILAIVDLTQPAVSHHLKILKDAGLLMIRKDGRKIQCSLGSETIKEYTSFLKELTSR
jgi:ArsR family transcriptional regulator